MAKAKAPQVTRSEIALSNGMKIEKTSISGNPDMLLLVTADGMHPLTDDDVTAIKSITGKTKQVTRKVATPATPSPSVKKTTGSGQAKRYDTAQKLAILTEIDNAKNSGSSQAAVLRQANYPSANTVGLWLKQADIIEARG